MLPPTLFVPSSNAPQQQKWRRVFFSRYQQKNPRHSTLANDNRICPFAKACLERSIASVAPSNSYKLIAFSYPAVAKRVWKRPRSSYPKKLNIDTPWLFGIHLSFCGCTYLDFLSQKNRYRSVVVSGKFRTNRWWLFWWLPICEGLQPSNTLQHQNGKEILLVLLFFFMMITHTYQSLTAQARPESQKHGGKGLSNVSRGEISCCEKLWARWFFQKCHEKMIRFAKWNPTLGKHNKVPGCWNAAFAGFAGWWKFDVETDCFPGS